MADIENELQKLINKVKGGERPDNLLPDSEPEEPPCPNCHGYGFLRRENLSIHDPDFGKVFPCDCSKHRLYSQVSGLTEREMTTLAWNRVVDADKAHLAMAIIRETLEQGAGWVYLWGKPGLAKTVLLKVAVVESVRLGQHASYTNMSAILEDLRCAYDMNNPNYEAQSRLDNWGKVNILAIDEFDRVKQTEFVQEKQFRLMDNRYQTALMGQTVTLMASNSPPSVFDGYLADRILDGRFVVFEMTGESKRPAQYWQNDI